MTVKINSNSGVVMQTFDMKKLREQSNEIDYKLQTLDDVAQMDACSNGIAYNDKEGTFIVTGKLWPRYYITKLEGEKQFNYWLIILPVMCAFVLAAILLGIYVYVKWYGSGDSGTATTAAPFRSEYTPL